MPGPRWDRECGTSRFQVGLSAGSLYSTTEDLLRWEEGLSLSEGSIVTVGDEYAPSTSVLRFEVREAGFDPSRADPLLSPAS